MCYRQVSYHLDIIIVTLVLWRLLQWSVQLLTSSCHNPQCRAVKYKDKDMKTVSIKTMTALFLFVFLLALRFKLYRDRQHSLQLKKANQKQPENSFKTNKTSIKEEKATESNELELKDLTEIYEERRKYVGEICRKHREGIEERYRSRWPDRTWETFLGKADIL